MGLLGIRVSVEGCYIIFISRSNQSGRYPLELFTTEANIGAGAPAPRVGKDDRRRRNGHHSLCVWLTGLPRSGKSTIARRVEERLFAAGVRAYVLDGDALRRGLCRDLGFSTLDRGENVRRVAETARILVDAGVVVVTALISPYPGRPAKGPGPVRDGRVRGGVRPLPPRGL